MVLSFGGVPFSNFSLPSRPHHPCQGAPRGATRTQRVAQLGADLTALENLISDDLLFTGPDGQLGSKAQDLEAYRSGTVKFVAHVPEELRIRRVSANVAITSLRAQLTVQVAENLSRGTYRYTRVWARDDGRGWCVVGGHVSLVSSLDANA